MSQRPITDIDVLSVVSTYFDVPMFEILAMENTIGKKSMTQCARARWMAWYLMYTLTPLGYKKIARLFKCDHSSVIHGIDRVREARIGTRLYRQIQELEHQLSDTDSLAVEDVQAAVCEHCGITLDELLRGTSRYFAYCRHLAMYVARRKTNKSFEAIGASFGCDSTTTQYGVNCIANEIESDRTVKQDVWKCESLCKREAISA